MSTRCLHCAGEIRRSDITMQGPRGPWVHEFPRTRKCPGRDTFAEVADHRPYTGSWEPGRGACAKCGEDWPCSGVKKVFEDGSTLLRLYDPDDNNPEDDETWEADDALCLATPPKSANLWWMNADQYDSSACRCSLPLGHERRHACLHGGWS